VVTPANIHDKHALPQLLHGQERRVYGDSAYASQQELIASKAPHAKDFTNQRTRRNGLIERGKNRNKSKIRARVEHVFAVVKRLWGFIESPLPWPEEEWRTGLHGAGAGQSLPESRASDGSSPFIKGQCGAGAPPTPPNWGARGKILVTRAIFPAKQAPDQSA
jgi:hypothetical protein